MSTRNRLYKTVLAALFLALALVLPFLTGQIPEVGAMLCPMHIPALLCGFFCDEFLKIDSSGEFYWDDEFIFETDPTSTLMANREAMWQQTDMKLQSQAFGPLGDMETLRTYWTVMKASGYPNAGTALDIVEARIAEQKQQAQMEAELMAQQQQEQPMEGEMQDAMPVM